MGLYAVVIQNHVLQRDGSTHVAEKTVDAPEDETKAKELCKERVAKGKDGVTVGILSVYRGPEGDPWQWREIFRCANKGGEVVDMPPGYPVPS